MPNRKKKNAPQSAAAASVCLPGIADSAKKVKARKDSLKPREHCNCEATKHALINNCIHCGRIVCSAEQSGPCFTCGNLVCTNEELMILSKDDQESLNLRARLYREYKSLKGIKSLLLSDDSEKQKAIARRNKLLEYNNTSARRTIVVDEEEAFDPRSNKWLTNIEREQLHRKQEKKHELRHGQRKAPVVTFDFNKRRVVEDTPSYDATDINIDDIVDEDISIYKCPDFIPSDITYAPQYCDEVIYKNTAVKREDKKRENIRIQDKEIQYMTDKGLCLIVDQPFASLIVAGIKKHIGQEWCTIHRGRLWIQSSTINSTAEDTATAEGFYRSRAGDVEFPDSYPSGALLGCVDLVESLPQELYAERYPGGECGTEHVYICENARKMRIHIPVNGGRRMYEMDPTFLQAAKKLLM